MQRSRRALAIAHSCDRNEGASWFPRRQSLTEPTPDLPGLTKERGVSAITLASSSNIAPISTCLRPALALCLAASLALQPAIRAQTASPMVLSLSQAIDLAMRHNHALELAQLDTIDSEQQRHIARSTYFPQIANVSKISHVTEIAGVDVPAGEFGSPSATGPIPAQTLIIGQGASTSYTSGTQLTQPVTQLLRLVQEHRAATSDVNMSKIHVSQVEDDVALRVRELYFGLLAAELNLRADHDQVAADQAKDDEATDAVATGHEPDATAVENHATLLAAKQTVLKDQIDIHKLTLLLNDFLGLPLSSILQLDPASVGTDLPIPTREECLRIAHDHNLSIKSDQEEVIKAKANVAEAKSRLIPDINGLARYSYQSGVPLYVHNFGTFGIDFNYDVFDGGRRIAKIKSRKVHLSQAQISLNQEEERVTVEVETAYDKIEQLQDLVQLANQLVSLRENAAHAADQQAEQGASLASSKADTHATALAAKASLLQATVDLSIAKGELERLIGRMPR